jgi:hypothetical protein
MLLEPRAKRLLAPGGQGGDRGPGADHQHHAYGVEAD